MDDNEAYLFQSKVAKNPGFFSYLKWKVQPYAEDFKHRNSAI